MGRRGDAARYRLEHVGELTPENLMDWAVVLANGALLAVAVYQLGGYPPLGVPLITLGPLAGLVMALHALSWWGREHPEVHPWGWVVLPFLAWVGWRVISSHPAPWLGELYGWTWVMAAVVWWTVLHHARTKEQVAVLLAFPVGAMGLTLVAALYQVLHQPDWLPLGRIQIAAVLETQRVSGSFGQPVGLAGYLELLFPLLVLAAGARRLTLVLRGLLGFLAVAALVGWAAASDRSGAWVMGPVLILLPFFLLRSRLHQAVATVVVVLAVAATGVFRAPGEPQEWARGGGEVSWATLTDSAEWAMFRQQPHQGQGLGAGSFRLEAFAPEGTPTAMEALVRGLVGLLAELGWVGFVLLAGPFLALVIGSASVWLNTPFLAVPVGGEARVTPQAKILLGWMLLASLAATLRVAHDDLLALPAYLWLLALLAALAAQRLTKRRWRRALSRAERWLALGVALLLGAGIALRGAVVGHGTRENFVAHERLQVFFGDPRGEHIDERFLEQTRRGFERALLWLPGHAEARAHLGVTLLQLIRFRPERRSDLAQAALGEIEAARRLASHWRFEVFRAHALERLGRPAAEVVAAGLAAVAAAPHQPDAWYQLAVAQAQVPGGREQALVALEKVFTLDPRHENGRILASRLTSP